MTKQSSPRDVFRALVEGVAEHRWKELPELYAAETKVVHPIDPLGEPPLLSREDLRAHFADGAEIEAPFRFHPDNIVIHETADPEVIVAEFTYEGTVLASGKHFSVPCVFVLRVRDGEIAESRDYIDPIALPRALGGLDELFDGIRAQDGEAVKEAAN